MELTTADYNHYLTQCIGIAKRAPPHTGPPYVGALVLSPQGEVVGEGYRTLLEHTLLVIHAERMALNAAGEKAQRGTLFTTLEPCVLAHSRQLLRSCAEYIVESGIGTIVMGMMDTRSNSFQAGEGAKYLRNHGLNVIHCPYQIQTIERELTRHRK